MHLGIRTGARDHLPGRPAEDSPPGIAFRNAFWNAFQDAFWSPFPKLLLERPEIDTDIVDGFGKTALTYAKEKGHLGIVKMLEARNAK